jgi:hypothetical protein
MICCSTITLLAHSMPGAGVVHHIILDRASRSRPPLDVRFDLKATNFGIAAK